MKYCGLKVRSEKIFVCVYFLKPRNGTPGLFHWNCLKIKYPRSL